MKATGRFIVTLVGAVAWAAVISGPATAQGWEAAWASLKQAAAGEGGVICACPRHPVARDYIVSQWRKDFPDVPMTYTPSNTPTWQRQIETEREGGKYLWDVYMTGTGPDTFRLSRNGVLDPVLPVLIRPDVNDPKIWGGWDDAFQDEAGKHLFSFFLSLSMPYYNAKVVSPDDVKVRGLSIMLDPAYKGKAVWRDPRVGGIGNAFLAFFYDAYGPEKTRQLIADQAPVFVRNENEVAKRMVQGGAAFGVASFPDVLEPFKDAGLTFDIRPIGNTARDAYASSAYGIFAVVNRAPHPNAAKLFANWILTKEVQDGFAKATARDSRRTDIEANYGPVPRIKGERYNETQKEEKLTIRAAATALAKQARPN